MDLHRQLAVVLGERYRVERELGRGGMAVVFLALDLKHQRPVAIKVLPPELSAALGADRFLREISIAATLQHPHILPLFDSGRVTLRPEVEATGQPSPGGEILYYVMPFVEGESLRQRLSRDRQLPLDVALRITRDVGSALQHAHDRGVIHRDVKPENIMLTGDQAVVADFGIARALHAAGGEQLTLTGLVVGTPYYMSPEQAAGGAVDGRSDQYSLACMLYEMLIGEPPFNGPTPQAILARHSLEPVPSLRVVRQTIPEGVEASVARALSKLPVDRFPSVERFLDALGAADTGPAQARAPAPRPRRQQRNMALVGAALVLGAGAWWSTWHPGQAGATGAVRSVAVLPFHDPAAGPDGSYLADGMTEGLIADLAAIDSLKVISRSSGAAAQSGARSLGQLASQLGVEAVVKGTVRRVDDTVWLNVQVLRTADSTQLFAGDYRATLGRTPDLQQEITTAIAASIRAGVKGTDPGRHHPRSEVDRRAYESYLRGRFLMDRDQPEEARAQFEEALRVAPDWAPPYVGLARYYTSLPFHTDVPPVDVLPKARSLLAEALQLDESLAEAHAINGYVRAYYDWDWRAAEQEFRRAIELEPSYADAYFSYARFLASRGQLDQAIAMVERAVDLDPLSLSLQANRALLDYFAGRYQAADERLRNIYPRDSTNPVIKWGLALVAEQLGRPDEAIALLEPISASYNRKATLGHAYAIAGKTAKARSILAALDSGAARTYVPSYWFAVVHAGLGEPDRAIRYLERAYQERSTVLAYLLIDPRLAPLRDDPRFQTLAGRLRGQ